MDGRQKNDYYGRIMYAWRETPIYMDLFFTRYSLGDIPVSFWKVSAK